MNDDKSLVPMNYKEMTEFSKIVLKSQMFNSIKSAEQCLLTMMAGREMGMGFIEACNSIYLVNGKVSLFYPKVGELIKRSGKYDYKIKEHDNQKCVITFYQLSLNNTKWEEIGESAFTIEDAKIAKLSGDNWNKYPRNMLFARALTNGARFHTPDVFGGSIYEPEELGAQIEYAEDGETVEKVTIPTESRPQPVAVEEAAPVTFSENTQEYYDEAEANYNNNGLLKIDKTASTPSKTVMESADFTISSFTEIESQNKAGVLYRKVTFANSFNLPEEVTARWPEYTVAPYHFEDKPDMYRALQSGDLVMAKLTFEVKKTPTGDKNYQNVEVLMRYPERLAKEKEEESQEWQQEQQF